jgi:hypothetical protein
MSKTTGRTIGICLDGVLRNVSAAFAREYRKYIIARGGENELLRRFGVKDIADLVLPGEGENANPFVSPEQYRFKDQAELDDFVQGEGFYIFASGTKVDVGASTQLADLFYRVQAMGDRLVLLSGDRAKQRQQALLFAARLGGLFDEVRFVNRVEEFWDGVDVLVAANPAITGGQIPRGKKLIHFLTSYNNEQGLKPMHPRHKSVATGRLAKRTRVQDLRRLVAFFPPHEFTNAQRHNK